MKEKVIKAVKERYVSIPSLKVSMYEDMDTVLMNLSIDLDHEVSEEEILITINNL
jgi:hypothetical protein